MDSIIFDTETTGLLQAIGNDLSFQPYCFELYAARLNKKFKIIDEFHALFKIPVSIPSFISGMTGINDIDLINEKPFKKYIKPISKIWKGCEMSIAHNLTFDETILMNEMKRNGKFNFELPIIKYCTVEQSMHLKGYRLKNSELYELLTGKIFEVSKQHRAKNDTLKTLESFKILHGEFNAS